METGIDKLTTKIRGSSKVEPIQGNKFPESFRETIATQVQQSVSEKKSAIRRKVKRKEQNVDKAGNNASPERQNGSSKQNDAKTSMKIRELIKRRGKKTSTQKLDRKERIESLRAKVAGLKKESLILSSEFRRWATICAELQEQITKKRKLHEADNGACTPDSETVD